jgi:hypothetical protein
MTTALEGGEGSASHPGRSLPPGKIRYPLYRRLGGPVWTGAKNLAPTGIRSSDRPARSQSLHRLGYPAHHSRQTGLIICHLILFVWRCRAILLSPPPPPFRGLVCERKAGLLWQGNGLSQGLYRTPQQFEKLTRMH